MKGKRNMKGTFKTLKTFKKLEEPELYVMDYVADYNLDKLLAMGSGSDEEFAKNVCKTRKILYIGLMIISFIAVWFFDISAMIIILTCLIIGIINALSDTIKSKHLKADTTKRGAK